MKRIIVLATNDFATDQRVLKVADVFSRNDFDVLLLGRKVKNELHVKLPFDSHLLRVVFKRSFLFYIEFNIRCFLFLLFSKHTHVLSNDTDTLLAGFFASKLRSKKFVFDAHELFPEIPELHQRKFPIWVWTKIEDFIFPKLSVSLTVCQSIATYYQQRYGIQMEVIRNIPSLKKPASKRLDYGGRKIILYQGALNIGRGLEWVIDAMPQIQNAVLVIIGSGDIEYQLRKIVIDKQLTNRVFFIGRVPGDELYKYTSSASLGLCLLESIGLSYYYALPNRVFDYLHAGVPILATDFPEIRNIVANYNTGLLIKKYDPTYLASIITNLLDNKMDTTHFATIANELCWERETEKLNNIIATKL